MQPVEKLTVELTVASEDTLKYTVIGPQAMKKIWPEGVENVKKKHAFCPFWPWATPPAPFLEQSLEILTSSSHQPLTIHTPEAS